MLGSERIKGFTLIELIVVIALISIMLFLAIPRFHSDIFTDSTKKVSRWILYKVPALKESAFRGQKRYVLHVGIDSEKLWITHEGMSDEELQVAEMDGFKLPGDIKFEDVEFPDEHIISAGRADIYFYEKGYSDKAIIHMVHDDDRRLSFLIEPFLPRVYLYNEYIGFEDS
jgi:prepilin-type N-terminal cleavage/methylation domain-containing protein